MKIKYNQKDDVLLMELAKGSIDYAEQTGNVIVHFSPKREALLLEILNASELLKDINKVFSQTPKQPSSTHSITHRIK